jgi:hypothetical protein
MSNPFINIPDVSDEELEESLGEVYLTPEAIEWDLDIVSSAEVVTSSNAVSPTVKIPQITLPNISGTPALNSLPTLNMTTLADVSIKAPEIPQFDVSKIWKQQKCGTDLLTIYTTLPEIPKVQRDISITTDINRMTDEDLLKLFPNNMLHTRASVMYVPQNDLPYDEDLGIILPIEGYTLEQCKDNIIQYPHFYKLARYDSSWTDNNGFRGFYSSIEIDGELVDTLDVWNSLEISKIVPTTPEYIKEYVVRKYLLDRDI